MKWFRWYHGTVDDRKWLVVSRKSGQPRAVVIAIWCALLEFASQAESRGSIAGFDCESLDALLDLDDGSSEAVLNALADKGLISRERLAAWEKRQPGREDELAADRQRRRRQRLTLPPAEVAPREALPPSGPPSGSLSEDARSSAAAPSASLPPDSPFSSTFSQAVPDSCSECHALSRTVTHGHAPEEEKEERDISSPPSPPQGRRGARSPAPRVTPPDRDAAPLAADLGDMGFQQLVEAYPAAHIAPRAEALDIWQRLGRARTRPGLPRLLQSLALWQDSPLWRKEDGRYIPKLANFLRRRMWEDIPPSPSSGEDWNAAEARQKAYRARMNALLQEVTHG